MLYMDSIKNLMVRIANRLKDTMLRRKLMLLVVVLIVGLIISAILGIGQAVRHWVLVPGSGVRIPHPQPRLAPKVIVLPNMFY